MNQVRREIERYGGRVSSTSTRAQVLLVDMVVEVGVVNQDCRHFSDSNGGSQNNPRPFPLSAARHFHLYLFLFCCLEFDIFSG